MIESSMRSVSAMTSGTFRPLLKQEDKPRKRGYAQSCVDHPGVNAWASEKTRAALVKRLELG